MDARCSRWGEIKEWWRRDGVEGGGGGGGESIGVRVGGWGGWGGWLGGGGLM